MKTQNTPQKVPLAQAIKEGLALVTELPYFEGFHAGTHTDSAGKTHTFSRDDLQQMVDNFEPGTVPFVTGHPTADAPAYGFAKSIKLSDEDKLYLDGDGVDINFAASVMKGHYGKRSLGLEFSKDKGWFIDHVAFLGAVKPALNLLPVGEYKFSQANKEPLGFEFSIETTTANVLINFIEKFQRWMLESGNAEASDRIVDNWGVDWLQREVIRKEVEEENNLSTNYSTNNAHNAEETNVGEFTKEDLDKAVQDAVDKASAGFSQQLSDKDKELETFKTQAAKTAFSQKVNGHKAWVSELLKDNKIMPAQVEGLAEFMAHIDVDGNDGKAVQFQFSRQVSGKDEDVSQSPVEFFKALFEANKAHGLTDDIETINDDTDHGDLHEKTMAYSKKHNVSYSVALDAVQGGA